MAVVPGRGAAVPGGDGDARALRDGGVAGGPGGGTAAGHLSRPASPGRGRRRGARSGPAAGVVRPRDGQRHRPVLGRRGGLFDRVPGLAARRNQSQGGARHDAVPTDHRSSAVLITELQSTGLRVEAGEPDSRGGGAGPGPATRGCCGSRGWRSRCPPTPTSPGLPFVLRPEDEKKGYGIWRERGAAGRSHPVPPVPGTTTCPRPTASPTGRSPSSTSTRWPAPSTRRAPTGATTTSAPSAGSDCR